MFGKKDEAEITLGAEYRDSTTGFVGTAIAKHIYHHGCTRVTLVAMVSGDIKEFAFDAPALVEVKSEAQITSQRTGGPRPTPGPRPT